jgi:nitrate reductase gamma subunit
MAEFLNHMLFGIYPYIALAVLALGSVVRYDREPYSWRSGSSQLLRRKQLMWGSVPRGCSRDFLWTSRWIADTDRVV